MACTAFFYCVIFFIFLPHSGSCLPLLHSDYYAESCPRLPEIVHSAVRTAFENDSRVASVTLELQFQDCFVNGCDGSILLDDKAGEKNPLKNLNSWRAFNLIDRIKSELEQACPSTVSCADILTLATRDSVVLASKLAIRTLFFSSKFSLNQTQPKCFIRFARHLLNSNLESFQSGGPSWPVLLGRRDAQSAPSGPTAAAQLASPFEPLDSFANKFRSKGLNATDVVALLGAHTIGFAQCRTFKRRLSDYKGSGKPDATLNPKLLPKLRAACPDAASDTHVYPLNSASPAIFDNSYYQNLLLSNGLLESDQILMSDRYTAALVVEFSKDAKKFFKAFGESMVKLASVGVITAPNGEIRRNCRFVNPK